MSVCLRRDSQPNPDMHLHGPPFMRYSRTYTARQLALRNYAMLSSACFYTCYFPQIWDGCLIDYDFGHGYNHQPVLQYVGTRILLEQVSKSSEHICNMLRAFVLIIFRQNVIIDMVHHYSQTIAHGVGYEMFRGALRFARPEAYVFSVWAICEWCFLHIASVLFPVINRGKPQHNYWLLLLTIPYYWALLTGRLLNILLTIGVIKIVARIHCCSGAGRSVQGTAKGGRSRLLAAQSSTVAAGTVQRGTWHTQSTTKTIKCACRTWEWHTVSFDNICLHIMLLVLRIYLRYFFAFNN